MTLDDEVRAIVSTCFEDLQKIDDRLKEDWPQLKESLIANYDWDLWVAFQDWQAIEYEKLGIE